MYDPESLREVSVKKTLGDLDIAPLCLQAKEALGIMNGTATSAVAGILVIYDTNNLAILTRILTAMSTEALLGTEDNFHDFISRCRPHPG